MMMKISLLTLQLLGFGFVYGKLNLPITGVGYGREALNRNRNTSLLAQNSKRNIEIKLPTLNAFELCICGAIATAFGDLVMHPIDTIKVTQQTAAAATGIIETAKAIFTAKGPLGFYQGVVPYLIGDGLSGAVKFATFELARRFTEKKLPEKWHGASRFVCAAGAMIACSFIMVPAEVLKTRLQAGTATGLVSAITNILQTDGIPGLFVGYYATLVRDVPYTMLELGIYENLKIFLNKFQKRSRNEISTQDELVAAAITGGVTAFLTTPLDLVKTKLMMQTLSGGQYSGVADALNSIFASGGLSALFVGSTARTAWLLPFTTIYLGVYEATKRKLLDWKVLRLQSKTLEKDEDL